MRSATRSASPLRRSLLVIAGVCTTLTAGVPIAAELYLRAALKPPASASQHVFARPPLVRLRVTISRDMPGLDKGSTVFTTNALGVRGDELDLGDESAFKILTLGDSVTECLLLSDADAWPRRLQDRLEHASERRIWVGNAAGSGELSLDYVVHMQKLVPHFDPDLVVVMPGGYELQAAVEEKLFPMDLRDPRKLADYAQRLYADRNAQAQKNLAELATSHLAFMLRTRWEPDQLDMTEFYLRMRTRRAASPKLRELPDFDDALDVYKANLRAIIESWRALPKRPRLVLLTRPFLWKSAMSGEEESTLWGGYTCMDCDDPKYYAHDVLAQGLRRFNQTMLEICHAEDVPCFDLDARIPKNLDNFYDDAHMRAPGAALTARELANFLIARRLVH